MRIELKTELDMQSVYATWHCPNCGLTIKYRYMDFVLRGWPVCLCDTKMTLAVPIDGVVGMSVIRHCPTVGADDQQMNEWNSN